MTAQSKSGLFLIALICFVCGVGAASFVAVSAAKIQIWLAVVIALALVNFWRKPKTRIILLAGLFFVLGFWRFSLSKEMILNQSGLAGRIGSTVSLRGVVSALPDYGGNEARYLIQTKFILSKTEWQETGGRILLVAKRFPEFNYGDELVFTCSLQLPNKESGWLAKQGASARCDAGEGVERVNQNEANLVLGKIFFLRQWFLTQVEQTLPEPQAGLLAGLLVGERAGFSETLKNNFQATGTTHVIAISGWNVALLTVVFFNMLVAVALDRKKAFWATSGLLVIFIIFVGAGASVVRAGIMGGIVMIGKYLGRSGVSIRLLVLAGALMTAINPWLIRYDLGFILSFAATAGLTVFSEPIYNRLKFMPEGFKIRENLSQTLAATFSTLPFIVYSFGSVSLVAPLANLFILLIVPQAMWLGFVATLFHEIPYVGPFFGLLVWFALSAILGFVNFFGALPYASLVLGSTSIFIAFGVGVVVLMIVYFVYKSRVSPSNL